MSFVELHRSFVRIEKEQEPNLDIGRGWGRKFGGWLGWPDLREHRRIVLLAEASSGKSAEFRNQADILCAAGKPAFFVTIEDLADQGFEDALEPESVKAFEQWRDGIGEAWFFLDSLDEARLNRKNFESALRRFSRVLGASMERARLLISCRVSDWKGGEDRGFIERLLPAWERPQEPEAQGDPLLDPIFKQKEPSRTRPSSREIDRKPNELLVVQLVPLDLNQCRLLAAHFGVPNADEFVNGIRQNSLEAFAERPGDVIDLADYWGSYGQFGPFVQMVEHGISHKLSEISSHRADNDALSLQRAREGAERLAAALTLGKSFTLRTPGHEADPGLATGALDTSEILDDWTEAERNALLRRGIFAPATYGRIRFHHRSSQEYLTARWLDRLLRGSGRREEIWNLIFASRYGVETIVPSLRPAAAWLAVWHSDILNEVIAREPLVLVRNGDPASLPIEPRRRMLAAYASKQARGDISDDNMDNRTLWMFADAQLSDAIRAAWIANTAADFRFELLRFIREGAIVACVDLARRVALDRSAEIYHRVVALDALVACNDKEGLTAASRDLVDNAANLPSRLAVEAATILYPNYITVAQLFSLIEQAPPPGRYSGEGFGYAIHRLFEKTPDAGQRRDFIARLGDLCLSQPLVEHYHRVSRRYVELARHVDSVARSAVQTLGDGEPSIPLVRLLMVVERAERDYEGDHEKPTLSDLVHAKPKVQRALFWADVAEQREYEGLDQNPTFPWQIMTFGKLLWRLAEGDLPWLFDDLAGRPCERDQTLALNSILTIFKEVGRLEVETPTLRTLLMNRAHLVQEMNNFLAPPPPPSNVMMEHERRAAEHNRRRAEQEQRDRESWTRFQQDLHQNPGKLHDPQKLQNWRAGAWRLWELTRWLMRRTGSNEVTAPTQWRLLEEGFGREVAERTVTVSRFTGVPRSHNDPSGAGTAGSRSSMRTFSHSALSVLRLLRTLIGLPA
jgi:hypothetical protein